MGRARAVLGAAMESARPGPQTASQWLFAPLLENTSLMSDAFKKK